jgi:nucleotide-binding universal stress UspA family protein
MQRFNNILFVSHGVADETEALKQALSLARNNKAELKVLIVCPDFPKEMADYKGKYEASLIQQLEASIQATREAIKVSETDVPVRIEVDSGGTPAIRIVRHVLKHSVDLIIKEAEPKEGGKGVMAMDMELLRKSPCPVWLTRPISHHRGEMKIAVAIDPESMAPEGHDLSVRLLQIANSLAATCCGALDIISCWHFENEEYLRSNASVWIRVPKSELDQLVDQMQKEHRAALEALIHESTITGGACRIHHIKGMPDQSIPDFIDQNNIDILVMGTVARTGIQGFIMGNTAENIVQKLSCSLLALKPNGFVSPVKAY